MKSLEELQQLIESTRSQVLSLVTGGIHYEDGRSYAIHYVQVSLPAEFEKQYPKGQSPKGWICPVGICSL